MCLFVRVCINVCVCVYNVISPPRKEAVHMHTIFFGSISKHRCIIHYICIEVVEASPASRT